MTEIRRYWSWKQGQSGTYPTEFLLSQIRKHIVLEEFPFIAANRENPDWSEEKLFAALSTW